MFNCYVLTEHVEMWAVSPCMYMVQILDSYHISESYISFPTSPRNLGVAYSPRCLPSCLFPKPSSSRYCQSELPKNHSTIFHLSEMSKVLHTCALPSLPPTHPEQWPYSLSLPSAYIRELLLPLLGSTSWRTPAHLAPITPTASTFVLPSLFPSDPKLSSLPPQEHSHLLTPPTEHLLSALSLSLHFTVTAAHRHSASSWRTSLRPFIFMPPAVSGTK